MAGPSVILYDSAGNPLAVNEGVAIPVAQSALLTALRDPGGLALQARADALGRHLVSSPGDISAGNSSTTPLGAGATFPGAFEDVSDYATVSLSVFADQNSATGGLKFEWSGDGVNADVSDGTDLKANSGRAFALTPRARYFRCQLVNGATPQTVLRLKTLYHRTGTGLISRPLSKPLDDSNYAQTVRAVLSGRATDGTYQNVNLDPDGNLLVAPAVPATNAPRVIELIFDASIGAIVAQAWRRVLVYTVPGGFAGYLLRFSSFQDETAFSRVAAVTAMGTLSLVTNTFTAGTAYTSPLWAPIISAVVTQALTAGAGDVTVTVTYTNEVGVGSRIGTITIPKGSAVDSTWVMTLQAGDLGVRSIQTASVAPTLAAGAIALEGIVQLAYHNDISVSTALETSYNSGDITFNAGTVLALAFRGGIVSKTRTLEALIQLVPVS